MDIVEHTLEVDVDGFLARPLFAHVATVTADGAARHSPMWYIREDGAVRVVANERRNTFYERIEHEPRCTVGFVDYDQTTASVEHVGTRGRASLAPFDDRAAEGRADEDDRAIRMLCRYLGRREQWPDRFQATPGNEENSWFEVVPEVAVVRDRSYEPGPEVLHGTAGDQSHWAATLDELAAQSAD